MTLHAKMAMNDLQRLHPSHCNFNLIKKCGFHCGRYRRFSESENCLILIISLLLLKKEKCASHFCKEPANKNKQFKITKTRISSFSDEVFKVTVINRALSYLNGGSLVITLTVRSICYFYNINIVLSKN